MTEQQIIYSIFILYAMMVVLYVKHYISEHRNRKAREEIQGMKFTLYLMSLGNKVEDLIEVKMKEEEDD